MKKSFGLFFLWGTLAIVNGTFAQSNTPLFVKDTKAAGRERLYKSLINTINKNLSLPLTADTEENWIDAFNAIELTRYTSPWIEAKIRSAFQGIELRSLDFQKILVELAYSNYSFSFIKEITQLSGIAENEKLYAMCIEYLVAAASANIASIKKEVKQRLEKDPGNAILQQLYNRLEAATAKVPLPPLNDLLHQPFFDSAVVVFSFQRKNRNYPGLTVIRDTAGQFVKDDYGNVFTVTQLARSITNMPGYISNGNTPQGIFRMFGTAVSRSTFIGPTPNIQLTMPCETSLQHFMNDSTIADTVWTMDWYKKLLPKSWKNYLPVYETYYAGKAGRTEIIAHGTTVDPTYYKGQPYYPLTPTLGCLCTKEIWNAEDGTRQVSDQQRLMDALQKAGGANGYYIVIEINDEQKAVTAEEILPLLNK